MSGKQTGGHDGDLKAVLADLEKAAVAVVHVGIVDLDGGFRERRFRLAELREFAEGGTFVNVLLQWDIADKVFGDGPFVGESVAIDPGSLRPYPFEADAALLVADYAGPSAALSPRELLRAQVAKAAAMGYDVRCAFEFEFIVLEETAHSLREKNFEGLTPFAVDNRCWAGQTAAVHGDFVARLEQRLMAAEVPLHALGVELGPGCFEATLKAGEPIRAADDATFFRLFTNLLRIQFTLNRLFKDSLEGSHQHLRPHRMVLIIFLIKYFETDPLKNFWDLSPSTFIQVGLMGLGVNSSVDSLKSRVYGADFRLTVRPPGQARRREFTFRTEGYLFHSTEKGVTRDRYGWYANALFRLDRRWVFTTRFDWVESPRGVVDTEWAIVPTITWWQSEFVYLRLEGRHEEGTILG
ncbi:MAG: hypothetical protein IIA72_19180, partial [Proteobacteria bacterium]|nr:hypothetical protein [Pseudomonadota bacterium]